jgi:PTS system fructose-specific IIA component
MNFVSSFDPNNISLRSSASSREEILVELTHILYSNNVISNESNFLDDADFREEFGMTGIGNGVAIPHGIDQCVNYPAIAVATLKNGIFWKSIDDQPVNLVLLFAEPEVGSRIHHTEFLANYIKKISNPGSLEALKNADTADMVLKILED